MAYAMKYCIVGYGYLTLVIPSAESFNFFYCPFADTAGISAAFFFLVSFHYHYDASMINALDYVAPDYP